MHDPHPPTWDDWQERLKELRDRAGVTQRALAHAAGLSKSTVNALETGRATPRRPHAVALDEALSGLGALSGFWDDVAGRGRRVPEWWAKPLELEKQATRILEYEPCIVPGLLQTLDYARAILGLSEADTDQVEKNAEMRTARLDSLQADVSVILTERALLSHPPGAPEIVPGQLDHVLNLIEKGAVRLQILPDDSIPLNAHTGFRIVALNSQQSVAYAENRLGGITKSDPQSTGKVATMFEHLSSDSLPVKMSMEWIRRTRSQWNSGVSPATAATRTTTALKSPSPPDT